VSRVTPADLESEALAARTPDQRTGLIVRLLATGEWVHGVTVYVLAGFWAVQPGEALGLLDAALGQFATVPGTAEALRGLGYARLCNLADRALAHERTTVDPEGGVHVYPDPQYAVAVKATDAAYALALKGDPSGDDAEREAEAIIKAIREGKLV
jgi:hypothetical protein